MKKILLSGATQGLGEALVLKIARDYREVKLVGFSSKQANVDALNQKIAEEFPLAVPRILIIKGDITSLESIDSVISQSITFMGGIDMLINNVGLFRFDDVLSPFHDTWDMSPDDFEKKFAKDADFEHKKNFFSMAQLNYVGNRNLVNRVVASTEKFGTPLVIADIGSIGVVADMIGKPLEGTRNYGHTKAFLVSHTLDLVSKNPRLSARIIHPGPFGDSAKLIAKKYRNTYAMNVAKVADATLELFFDPTDEKVIQKIICPESHFVWGEFGDLSKLVVKIKGLTSARISKVPPEETLYLEAE